MKQYEIEAVSKYLKQFDFIKVARRVANNTIELNFSKNDSIFFDLTRGSSVIYKAPSAKRVSSFNAPFDKILHSLLAYSKIIEVTTPKDDKVIIFKIKPKSQYKEKIIYVRFELTGKFTNSIITDENDIVIEALHHIDSSKSYREVKPGIKLKPLLPFKSKYSGEIDNVEDLLTQNYQKLYKEQLNRLKSQKLNIIDKKIKKLTHSLKRLPNKEKLLQDSQRYSNIANIVLANLHLIKPYDKELKTYDFEGKEITIKLPNNVVKNRVSEYFYNLSKRLKNKAKNIDLEINNLKGKLNFYQNIKSALLNSNDLYDIELLVPKQAKSKQKKEKVRVGELFWIEGYKIYVGTNSKENQELLKIAKANDIWMHVREIPGSHVIIRTDKQNLPNSLLESAAKLCVDFSTDKPGNYEVDYTKRKFVKVIEGSNVEYDKYKTIFVLKEGVEIRV